MRSIRLSKKAHVDFLNQEIIRLRAALFRYGGHDFDCPAEMPVPKEVLDALPDHDAKMAYLQTLINGCNCGFDDTKKTWEDV